MIKHISLFLPLVSCFFYSPAQRPVINNLNHAEDAVVEAKQEAKEEVKVQREKIKQIDAHIVANKDELKTSETSYGTIEGEAISTTSQLLRDDTGAVNYFVSYQNSESGDWYIGYHYYLNKGAIFGFKRTANFLNSGCEQGVVYEESIYTFDQAAEPTSKSYKFTNKYWEDLTEKNCSFPYDRTYQIAKTVDELLSNN